MAQIVLYPNEMDRLLRMPGGPVGRHCNFVARSVANESSRLAATRLRTRTGRLQRGYRVRVEKTGGTEGFQFWVVNNVHGQNPDRRRASYALVQESGSGLSGPQGKAYVIRPRRRAKNAVLVFYIGGKKVVTKQVTHPGVKPQNIMRDALTNVMQRIG